ncbi:MAG: M48 family metallopeptidase [archaeon]
MAKEIRHIDFRDEISRNKLKSFILVFAVLAVLIMLGYIIFQFASIDFFSFAIIWTAVSVLYLAVSYYNSDKIALMSVGARKADERQYRQLYNSVEGLTIASGLPMPKVYIMESQQINAFATGRDEKHCAVCVTSGMLAKLDKHELEGVLAHELTHIKNYDVRFATLVAVMVGMISIISEVFLRSLWYGGASSRDDKKGGNAVFMLIGIALAILAPIVVKLVQLAISRKREFMADAGSVEITRYPKGLISALKKISDDKPIKVNAAVAPLFFSSPMKESLSNLFQTHPDINKRIMVLEQM